MWNHISANKQQQNEVPQGSVLSVILFALKINNVINQIPEDLQFHYSLFVDDLQIGYHHTDTKVIEQVLQQWMNKMILWAQKNGFKFSPPKCKAMHFHKLPGLHLSSTTIIIFNIVWGLVPWHNMGYSPEGHILQW